MLAGAAATVAAMAVWVLAQEAPTDPGSLKSLGYIAPFFSVVLWLLYREAKKRDEAEGFARSLLQAQVDKYEPAMRAMETEMANVIRDATTEIRESRSERQRRRPRPAK